MQEYEINEETLAIVPIDEGYSQIYEMSNTFQVACNATKIIEESCLYFGSTLEGRRKGTESMIGIRYKAPIIIEEEKEIIFFPTKSSRYHLPIWIGLKNIKSYYRDNNEIVLEFKNDQKIFLNISYGSLDNQILRASRLESSLRGRKNAKKRLN